MSRATYKEAKKHWEMRLSLCNQKLDDFMLKLGAAHRLNLRRDDVDYGKYNLNYRMVYRCPVSQLSIMIRLGICQNYP